MGNKKLEELKSILSKANDVVISRTSNSISTTRGFNMEIVKSNPISKNEMLFKNVSKATSIIESAVDIDNRNDLKELLTDMCIKSNIDTDKAITIRFLLS